MPACILLYPDSSAGLLEDLMPAQHAVPASWFLVRTCALARKAPIASMLPAEMPDVALVVQLTAAQGPLRCWRQLTPRNASSESC